MPKVVWSADNDRKLLIRLIDRSAKSYDSDKLAQLFPGATPKAIEERIAKLKREAKALDGPKTPRDKTSTDKTSTGTTSNRRPSSTGTPRRRKRKMCDDSLDGGNEDDDDYEDGKDVKSKRSIRMKKDKYCAEAEYIDGDPEY